MKTIIRMSQVSIFIVCLILTTGCSIEDVKKRPPTAKKGILDLREWDLINDGTVKLDGEWEFYWKQLLHPKDFIAGSARPKPDYFIVPSIWNGHEINGQKLQGEGYGTFRLLIKVNPKVELFALKALEMAHAYKMWINSKETLANGTVGKSQETMKPQYLSKIAVIDPDHDTIELLLQVSNYTHKRGGVWNPIDFGTVDQIIKIREKNLTLEFILFGSLIIMGFYHLGLFFLRANEHSTLYFGSLCLLAALRVVLTGERIMHDYFPWLGWDWLVCLEYLTVYLGPPCFFLFLASIYPQFSKIPIRIITSTALVSCIIVIVTKPNIFSYTLPYFQIFILICCIYMTITMIRAILLKNEGAILIFLGSLLLLSTFVYDILIANGLIYGINIAPFGLFIFIFIQSFMLSVRFSKAYFLAETLSAELEEKVELRTQDLKKANREIRLSNKKLQETQSQLIQSQKMEAMGTLAGGIAHDFNNILGTILGYTELLLDEPALDSPSKTNLETIQRSVARAADLVRQILTFSRKNNQTLIPQQIQSSLEEILIMIRATLSESIEIKEKIDQNCGFVLANQTQISQIVVNLCTNAEHAMQGKGGVLEIELQEVFIRKNDYPDNADAEGSHVLLSIKDTGIGIADNIKDRIFDPYFTTKDVHEGSGLGLSIVHGIVRNHWGFIKVDSKLGEGTRFSIFFPVTKEKTLPIVDMPTKQKRKVEGIF